MSEILNSRSYLLHLHQTERLRINWDIQRYLNIWRRKVQRDCTLSFLHLVLFFCVENINKSKSTPSRWPSRGVFSANSPMIVITDLRLVSDYQLELSAHNLFYHRSALLWFILGHWVSNKPSHRSWLAAQCLSWGLLNILGSARHMLQCLCLTRSVRGEMDINAVVVSLKHGAGFYLSV